MVVCASVIDCDFQISGMRASEEIRYFGADDGFDVAEGLCEPDFDDVAC